MSNCTDSRLKDSIDTSAELSQKMEQLVEELTLETQELFEFDTKIYWPGARHCKFLTSEEAIQYNHNAELGPFIEGIAKLGKSIWSATEGDPTAINGAISQAVELVTDVVNSVLGGSSGVSVGAKGDYKVVTVGTTDYFVAVYSSTAQCHASQWFQTSDFYTSHYVFLVAKNDDEHLKDIPPDKQQHIRPAPKVDSSKI